MSCFKNCDEGIIDKVLTAATRVHHELGPGLLESVYEHALVFELADVGLHVLRQVEVPVTYRGHNLGTGFRADIIVEDRLLLELKCVEKFERRHLAQVITYLKLLGYRRGFLLNFHQSLLKYGIKRISI